MVTEEDLRAVALALPEAYEQASYGGSPSWRTKPRAFLHVREDLVAAVVFVGSKEDKDALIAANPGLLHGRALRRPCRDPGPVGGGEPRRAR